MKADDKETTTHGTPSPSYGFDKNLVSVKEQVQDKALKEYYSKEKADTSQDSNFNLILRAENELPPSSTS